MHLFLLRFAAVSFLVCGLLGTGKAAAPKAVLKNGVSWTAGSFTVSVWVKTDRLGSVQTFMSQDGKNMGRYTLQKRADDRFVFAVSVRDAAGTQGTSAASDFAPTPGVWYQLTGVYDAAANQARLYANGLPLASVPAPAAGKANAPAMTGREIPIERPGKLADGAIREARFYSAALSNAQVAALHTADEARLPNTFTWANPLYYQGSGPGADIHDPDILKDNGVYYCVATLAPFRNYTDRNPTLPDYGSAPGIALSASRDLKAWQFKGWILKSSALPADCPYKHQFWAPELHKINGRYYVIFSGSNWIDAKYNVGGRMGYYQFVGVADKITGPYSHFVPLPGPGVDTSLFQDDDGKTYVVWPRNEIHSVDLSRINQDQVTVGPKISQAAVPDDYKALGQPVPGTLEGPYLIKHAGTYYCFFAETYPDLYATGIAMAASLAGPWKLDPRVRVFPGGHQAEFIGPDGRWWTAYKHERSATTPWLSVDPLDFDAEGRVQMTPTTGPQSISLSGQK